MEAGGAAQGGHQTPEERRAQERTERPFSLLERMLNKYIISHSLLGKRKQWGKNGYITIFNIFFLKCHIVNETI